MATTDVAAGMTLPPTPYMEQDVHEVAVMLEGLENSSKNKTKVKCKKTTFNVEGSQDGIRVDSWKMSDWDYKRRDLPTYARGLFTTRNRRREPEIVVRGYDKFFNVGEVNETKWENVMTRTRGPYELTLKENGCIIFISGLEDGTLLVCSKHSTGGRADVELSHAIAGERRLNKQLAALGKTKEDLAADLRQRNVTAVAELCDDSFEEHILEYSEDKAGLYLHGINLNLPAFVTYPSALVQNFAQTWGFKQVGLTVMNDIETVKKFLEEVAETGAHEGRDVEGFVIRCQMSDRPGSSNFHDWFFKYKFEEPYLMYRQWRECTKAMISGKIPKYRKHAQITEEYLLYARNRLNADKSLGKLYQANHGIIALREDFLKFKNLRGSDAANLEAESATYKINADVNKDVLLVPIATIGCGKTTIAVALTELFGWGHVQNDNITGKGRPPKFTKACMDLLRNHPVVIADRNNAQKHERGQIIRDVKMQSPTARLVALNFRHDDESIDEIRKVTQNRVIQRGDNHQTIHAASDQDKFLGVMEGFIQRFEPVSTLGPPDNGFDCVIDLDPVAGSRTNLETVIRELNRYYPNLVPEVPSAERLDEVLRHAFDEYRPELKHVIPDRGGKKNPSQPAGPKKKKPLEYMSIDVPAEKVRSLLDRTFDKAGMPLAKFYRQLAQTRRIQPKFHVTLMHRANAKQYPELWERYTKLQAEAEANTPFAPSTPVGNCGVELERVVFDDRIMSIVVRLDDADGQWQCTNNVAHITVGTRDDGVKPKESNDLLARWLEVGSGEESGIFDIAFEEKICLAGVVKGVLSR